MNKYIKKQLALVTAVDMPVLDDNVTEIIITKKDGKEQLEFNINHFYLIKLEDYLLNPPPGFSLHSNWNNNILPNHSYYKCQCVKILGKMVKILGVAFDYERGLDLEENWDGWLPIKSVKILKEI